eukprot:2281941-Pleurochrysis_carterae.AAC.3
MSAARGSAAGRRSCAAASSQTPGAVHLEQILGLEQERTSAKYERTCEGLESELRFFACRDAFPGSILVGLRAVGEHGGVRGASGRGEQGEKEGCRRTKEKASRRRRWLSGD